MAIEGQAHVLPCQDGGLVVVQVNYSLDAVGIRVGLEDTEGSARGPGRTLRLISQHRPL